MSLVTAQMPPFQFGNATGDVSLNVEYLPLPQNMTYGNTNATTVLQQLVTGNIRLSDGVNIGARFVSVYPYSSFIDQYVNQSELLIRASGSITEDLTLAQEIIASTGRNGFNPQAIVVATWYKVEALNCTPGQQNTFQLIMPYSDTGETWVILAYSQLQWFASPWLSRDFATVLFDWPEGKPTPTFYYVVNSTETMIQLLTGTNCNRKGIYAYRVNAPPPVRKRGVFGFGILCPLTLCGFFGRLFGLCPTTA
jgi:Nidogen-like